METYETLLLKASMTRAMIRAMGMVAENITREQNGQALAYDQNSFEELIVDEGIDYNSAITSARSMFG